MIRKSKRSATEIYSYGRALEKLGKALQSPNTRMSTLAILALSCGLELHLGISQRQTTSSTAQDHDKGADNEP